MLYTAGSSEQLHRRLAHSNDWSDVGADHCRTHRLRRSSASRHLLLLRRRCMSLYVWITVGTGQCRIIGINIKLTQRNHCCYSNIRYALPRCDTGLRQNLARIIIDCTKNNLTKSEFLELLFERRQHLVFINVYCISENQWN